MLTESESQDPVNGEPVYEFVPASTGKRLANYLIDMAFFYMIVFFWAVITAIVSPATIDAITDNNLDMSRKVYERILTLLAYALVMSLIEAMLRGKSIGKLITGTKAINADGTDISFSTAFARGLSRAVPFEAFSALGNPCYPWHDRWTDTYVIDEKQTRLHNEQLRSTL